MPGHRHVLLSLILALSTVGSIAQAASGTRTSAFEYDAATGMLVKEIVEPDNSNLCLVTTYTYDAFGNRLLATQRNCNGSSSEAAAPTGDAVIQARTSNNAYDARGQFATSSTNALNQTETKTYDPKWGTLLSLTGPNGLTTTWQYDDFGRKALETRSDGSKTQWSYQYCQGTNNGTANCPTVGGASGAWLVQTTPQKSDGTQNGPISKTYYDGLNRAIRSETQGFDGNGTSTAIFKDTHYDSLGRPYKTSRPYYSGQGTQWIIASYDSIGRAISQTDADGAITSTSYNGLSTTTTNPKNQTRTTTKNSQGQVTQVTDSNNQTLSYTYDPFGNLIKTTDPLGNQVTLTYDAKGRKTSMVDPDMGQWSYAYNALDQLIRQTDANAQVSTLTYDKLGRLTQRTEADLISAWHYDTYKGGGTCPQGIGKLCQAETDSGYNRIHNYDAQGRPTTTTTTIDTNYTASVTYDTQGRVATQTYPGGITVKYVYTTLGYLKEVRDNQSNALYWQANSLDAEGHLQQQTYGNGVVTQHTYNPQNGRLTSIQAGAGNSVQNLTYTYDVIGNIQSRNDANQNLVETFTYDSLNRMSTATVNSSGAGIVTTTYGYNAIGNITSKSDVGTYNYNPSGANAVRPHGLTRLDLTAGGYRTYQYDANGNLNNETQYDANNNVIANKGRIQVQTSFNMPQAIGAYGYSSGFAYGPEHQRVRQVSTSASGTTIYLNPGNEGGLLYEKDYRADGSTEQRNFISGGGGVIAVIKQVTSGSTTTTSVKYFQRDNLGSTTAVTDETGAVVERFAYEPFGKRRFPNGTLDPNNTIDPANTERGFTNHEHLDELGLIHMNGRIYDPLTGRFTSADPHIQSGMDLQSYNRYAYVLNNPLMYTDPSGYFSIKSWFKGSAPVFLTGGASTGIPKIDIPYWSNFIRNQPGQQYVDQYVMTHQWAYSVGQIAVTAVASFFGGPYAGAGAAAAWSTYYTYESTGSTSLAFKAGVTTYATAMAFYGVGEYASSMSTAAHIAAHAAVGCVSSAASGGSCGSGALAAGFSAAAAPYVPKGIGGVIASAVVGGTASVLGGGKFANGAVTGAFSYLFNYCEHGGCTPTDSGSLRGSDSYGSGEFGVSRDGGSRQHLGQDFVASPGEVIVAPIDGRITRTACPYCRSGDASYSGLVIVGNGGSEAKLFYVKPYDGMVGSNVSAGQPIGVAQNLQVKYKNGMTNHVHVELRVGGSPQPLLNYIQGK